MTLDVATEVVAEMVIADGIQEAPRKAIVSIDRNPKVAKARDAPSIRRVTVITIFSNQICHHCR